MSARPDPFHLHVADQILCYGVIPVVLLAIVAFDPVDVPGVAGIRHHYDEVERSSVLGHAHARPVGVVACQAVQQVEHGEAIA